jgi:hypothetical protein
MASAWTAWLVGRGDELGHYGLRRRSNGLPVRPGKLETTVNGRGLRRPLTMTSAVPDQPESKENSRWGSP